MQKWAPLALLLALFFSALSCAGRLVRQPYVENLNEAFLEEVYVAKKDISVGFAEQTDVLFKKGTHLKLHLEGRAEWLKLRAYTAETAREQARPLTIVYIFGDDLPASSAVAAETDSGVQEYLALKQLMEAIRENLTLADKKTGPGSR